MTDKNQQNWNKDRPEQHQQKKPGQQQPGQPYQQPKREDEKKKW